MDDTEYEELCKKIRDDNEEYYNGTIKQDTRIDFLNGVIYK